MDQFCGTQLWDVNIWYQENPDFSQCFYLTLLVWIPCGLLWLLTPLDLLTLKKCTVNAISWSFLSVSKVIFTIVLVAISSLDIAVAISRWENVPQVVFPVHFVTPVIRISSFLLTLKLLVVHRRRGIQSSGTLFIFWTVLLVADLPQLRSVLSVDPMKRDNNSQLLKHTSWGAYEVDSFLAYSTCLFVMFLLNCFSDNAPTNQVPKANSSPERSASFPRRLIFQWFDMFMLRGLTRPVEEDTVWELNQDDLTATLTETFDGFWRRRLEQRRSKKVPSQPELYELVWALYQTIGCPIWSTALTRVIIVGLSLSSPQILGVLVKFMSSGEAIEKGILFAALLFLSTLTSAILNSQSSFRLYTMGLQMKGILSSVIYQKSLRMSFCANNNATTTGELINYMSVDTNRCYNAISNLHLIWEGPLVLIISLYLMYTRIGVAAFSALIVVFVCAPINTYAMKKLYSSQSAQMKEKDRRIKMMNEILNGIKILKLYAWEKCFQKNVEEVRKEEIKHLQKVAMMSSISYMIWTMFPFLVTFVCFATYVLLDEKNILDSQKVFVVISTILFLCGTITNFNLGIIALSQMWMSLKRIAKFLVSSEINSKNVISIKGSLALSIRNGTFNWDGDEEILKNINLDIPKGSLSAIVGSVGCGKSSLVAAFLGEMEKTSGTVNTDGSIAYVAQQAWIQNLTVQENILFGRPMNSEWYKEVVYACALKQDIEMFPAGDQTEIGERGINLSGGQKQRIALARAVYANADIYLLDDPLSAVDAHVGKHIFDNVIGPNGVLEGKTRLLVTHAVSFIPRMEMIGVLVSGRLCEKGTYKELVNGGHFSEFLLKHISEMTDEDQLDQIREVFKEEDEGRNVFDRAMSIRSTRSMSLKQRKNTLSTPDEVNKAPKAGTITVKESSENGQVNWRIYWKYFMKIGPIVGLLSFLMVLINEAFAVGGNLWMTKWSSDDKSGSMRNYYLSYYALFGLGRVVTMFLGTLLFSWIALSGARKMHDELLTTTLRLPMSFFDTTPLGRIMNRFSTDIDIVDMYLPSALRLGVMFFCNVCGVVSVVSYSNALFIYALLGLAVFYYFVQKIYITTSRQLKRVEAVTLSPIYSHFSESLAGMTTIRAFAKQKEFTEQNSKKIDCNQKCSYAMVVAHRWLFCRLEMIGSLIVLLAAIFAVVGRAQSAPAMVGLSITYALNATVVLSYFVRMFADIETNIVAVERIEEYSRLPTENPSSSCELNEKWPPHGRVQFQNLKLRYRPGLDSILRGISFTIQPGEKIGIVGRTGAGKSSLTLALFRIIEAAGGHIQIDGQNIATLDLQVLRRRLTIIPQDPVLFSGTLRINLDPYHQYTDDVIWTALELSHLKFYVSSQPLGLLHEISEGGDNLSVGQRQLVCLARAVLRKTKVLVLDEATAAVDLETDELIQNTIRTEFADCTVLTIAHRLHTIMDSDKIVVLEDGEIVEFDSPERLLKNSFSRFYGMALESGLTRSDFKYKTKL